jgi:hypothetical protein
MHSSEQHVGRLVDAHVHLSGPEGIDEVLSAGIVAVRNAGTRPGAEGSVPGCPRPEKPVVISSCWALYKKGGYGARFGVPVETIGEIKKEILRLKQAGADIIKVMASGMVSLRKPGMVTPGGFDRDELIVIVEEAARLGLGVMAHANAEPAILAAAGAGVRSVEHGFFMTREGLAVMARKRVFWTPTIGALVRAAETAGATADTGQFIARLVRQHLQMVQQAYEAGVPLAIGTDCVLPDPRYRAAYEAELSYLEQAGIPHDEVRRIACDNGASLLGLKSGDGGRAAGKAGPDIT